MKQKNSCFSQFIHYTILNVFGMIGLSCYILADTFFIAKGLGAKGLAALNLAIPVYSLIHGSGLMLGIGGAAKFSVFRSQKAREQSNYVFSAAICLMTVFASFFMLAGLLFTPAITRWTGASKETFAMTQTYLRVILLFSPGFMLNDILLCFVKNDGNPGLAMSAMLAGSFSNILFDYVFIFPLHLGIFGAVLATGIAPIISMSILSRHWFKKQNHFHFQWSNWIPSLAFPILSIGFPSLVGEAASGIVILAFNFIILNILGTIGVAAYGIIANISLVVISVFTGIAQGIQPLVSQAYGKNQKSDICQIGCYAIEAVLILSFLIYLLLFYFASPIAAAFNSEGHARLQQIAVTGIKLSFTSIPFAGFNLVLSMLFTSMERVFPAQAISLLRGFILILPMAFLLSFLAEMTGIWLAVPITEAVTSGIGIIFLIRETISER